MKFVCHNGEMLPAETPLFGAGNRGFRYGDGVFETIKVFEGRLLLAPLHFARLFTALQLLQIQPGPNFTSSILEENILQLCAKNSCAALARVRLAVYRMQDGTAGYVIEAIPLGADAMQWNKEGWKLVMYPHARKSCDALANLKSANYLAYVLAGTYATEKDAHEALVLNSHSHIADGSKTNLFILKKETLYTPALNQGCVAGVMRTHVLQSLEKAGYKIHQTVLSVEDIASADEIFCTNAIQGIRWVQNFEGAEKGNTITQQLYKQLFNS